MEDRRTGRMGEFLIYFSHGTYESFFLLIERKESYTEPHSKSRGLSFSQHMARKAQSMGIHWIVSNEKSTSSPLLFALILFQQCKTLHILSFFGLVHTSPNSGTKKERELKRKQERKSEGGACILHRQESKIHSPSLLLPKSTNSITGAVQATPAIRKNPRASKHASKPPFPLPSPDHLHTHRTLHVNLDPHASTPADAIQFSRVTNSVDE